MPMQWRPSNRKLSVCLTGNKINKAYSNMHIDCLTLELVLFCDTFEFADYREKALIYSDHFIKKILVEKVDNAGSRSLILLP